MSFMQIIVFIIYVRVVVATVLSRTWAPEEHSYYDVHSGLETSGQLLDEWTVVVDGGEQVAELIALELGYEFGGQVSLSFL